MPEWARDAAWIASIATLINIVTGRAGTAITWLTSRRDARSERAQRQWEARKSIRAYQETIDLKDMELAVKDRIIAALTAELDHLQQNGGAR